MKLLTPRSLLCATWLGKIWLGKVWLGTVWLCAAGPGYALDWRGNISTEFTYFPKSSVGTDNWNFNSSVAADVELSHDLADNIRLTVHPFVRWDQQDEERSRVGVKELVLSTSGDSWEFNAGLATVFWGVTESRNLVDIINQTDSVEDIAGDDKLGQLMLNFKWFSDYGDFEAYLLPQFHDRTFSGTNGRPFPGIAVDPDLTTYESSDGITPNDFALRWAHSFDSWDLGLHYFDGTSRDPLLIPQATATGVALAARYPQLQQVGLDAQGLYGDLAIKAELIHQNGNEIESHIEAVTGIEYTLVGLLSPLQDNEKLPTQWCNSDTRNPIKMLACNDRLDLGIVVEYLWDERGELSTHPFQSDLLAGLRFAFNDASSSDALLGLLQDLDGGATTLSLETSTRLFESYRLKVLGRQFLNTADDPSVSALKNESFLQLELSYFF